MRLFTKAFALVLAAGFAASIGAGSAQAVSKLDAPAVGASVELIAGKKASGKWKSCGVNMYHDKSGKCADARAKK
jgi:hypothetical protein